MILSCSKDIDSIVFYLFSEKRSDILVLLYKVNAAS